ncbi:MAG: tRNA pseudouridine(55) synthase TruB [Proteobacteria bacterium]|nr:tRNA pseudouridine(55) synthase TruB [Pseudomonadota bacterium]
MKQVSFANTCGIVLLDKPQGLSSSAAVQRVRHAFGRIKAGHTGSLDPLATGVLPICLGEATKVAGYLLDGDKEYEFTAQFGARTATGDLEGEVVETAEVPADLADRLREALPRFTGPQQQVPPMYSALKQGGQPLYRLARQGIEVAREPRDIRILALQMLECAGTQARIRVRCSKGTYVRTLAEDLARAVGTCAHLGYLRRTAVAPFEGLPMHSLEAVLADPGSIALLPPDAALPHLPAVALEEAAASRLRMGQAVSLPEGLPAPAATGLCRVYGPGGAFLGIGEILPGAGLKPVRLFNNLAPDLT